MYICTYIYSAILILITSTILAPQAWLKLWHHSLLVARPQLTAQVEPWGSARSQLTAHRGCFFNKLVWATSDRAMESSPYPFNSVYYICITYKNILLLTTIISTSTILAPQAWLGCGTIFSWWPDCRKEPWALSSSAPPCKFLVQWGFHSGGMAATSPNCKTRVLQ